MFVWNKFGMIVILVVLKSKGGIVKEVEIVLDEVI